MDDLINLLIIAFFVFIIIKFHQAVMKSYSSTRENNIKDKSSYLIPLLFFASTNDNNKEETEDSQNTEATNDQTNGGDSGDFIDFGGDGVSFDG